VSARSRVRHRRWAAWCWAWPTPGSPSGERGGCASIPVFLVGLTGFAQVDVRVNESGELQHGLIPFSTLVLAERQQCRGEGQQDLKAEEVTISGETLSQPRLLSSRETGRDAIWPRHSWGQALPVGRLSLRSRTGAGVLAHDARPSTPRPENKRPPGRAAAESRRATPVSDSGASPARSTPRAWAARR